MPKIEKYRFMNKINQNESSERLFNLGDEIGDGSRECKLSLTVTDTGSGIPAKDQNSLFRLFGKDSSNQDGYQPE